MPKTITTNKTKKLTPLERFIGADTRIMGINDVVVNNYIQVQYLDVAYLNNNEPDEIGKLYLFPIDNGKFCLQLCYLLFADNAQDGVADVISVTFYPGFFDQFPADVLMANQPFRFDQTTEQQFSVCAQSQTLLDQLKQTPELTPITRMLQQSQIVAQLLRRALECITIPFTTCQVPACRFLAFESERDKIQDAKNIIDQNLETPITIRELSRKVAINECYLKKGFKALTGTTIHDYQQQLRINKAKELLQEKRLSVTDVANTLGYSSISHFSTAFKRVTGMKPCELLA